MYGPDTIIGPDGQAIPGGLAAYGIGAMPSFVPPPEPVGPPPAVDPSMLAPPPGAPPGVTGMGAEAPVDYDAPAPQATPTPASGPLGTSPALLSFLQGRQPGVAPAPPEDTGLAQPSGPDARASSVAPQVAARGGRAAGRQPAPADLSPLNLGQAYDQTQRAAGAQIDAAKAEGDVAARQAEAIATARAAADKELTAANDAIKLGLKRDVEVRDQKQLAVDAANKEVDNFKIDPNHYWSSASTGKKIAWTIAMALSSIGNALHGKNGPDPVIGMLDDAIKEDVAHQMDTRDQLRNKAGRMGQERDNLERFSGDRFAQEQYLLAQKYTMAARQVETAGAKFGTEQAKAKTQAIAAGYYDKAAEAGQKAAEFATTDQRTKEKIAEDKRAAQAQVGLGYYTANQANRRADLQLAEDKRWHDIQNEKDKQEMDLKAQLGALKSAGKDPEFQLKLEKENDEHGVVNPVTGKFFVNGAGLAKMSEATRLTDAAKDDREKASRLEGDEKAKLLASADKADQAARTLVDDAQHNDVLRTSSTGKQKVGELVANTQGALTLIDEIKALRKDAGPKWLTTSAGQQAMQSKGGLLQLMIKETYQLGALDKGSQEVADKITGGDASKFTLGDVSTVLGAAGTDAKLEALAESLANRGQLALGSVGVEPGTFKFQRLTHEEAPEVKAKAGLLGEKTPGEVIEREQAGGGRIGLDMADNIANIQARADGRPGSVQSPAIDRAQANESLKYPGLSIDQEPHMDVLLKQAKADGDPGRNARAQLVSTVADQWTTKPDLARSVLNNLRDKSPELYKEAVSKLPAADREVVESVDTGRAEIQGRSAAAAREIVKTMPSDELVRQIGGDSARRTPLAVSQAAWAEVERRRNQYPPDPVIARELQKREEPSALEAMAKRGDALARQELIRRAQGEIKGNGGHPGPNVDLEEDMPNLLALRRLGVAGY